MKRLPLFRSLIEAALLCAGAFTLYAQAPFPEIFVVNSTGDGDDAFHGDGQCETAVGNGVCTLRAAIEETNAHAGGDGIFFSIPTTDPGYSNGRWTIVLTKVLPDISDSVNINGPGADKLALNAGGRLLRFFNVTTSGTVSLSGLALVNGGVLDDNGGGIQNYNAGTVNVTNCSLGAILALSDNTAVATDGGGIYNRAGGTINIINSELTATSADGGNGGCIYNSSTGTIHVTNSYLSDSYASANGVTGAGNGGAVYNAGTMTITNTTIYLFDADLTNGGGNPGGNGGGIYNAGTLTVTRSTIYQARAVTNGGGIYNADFASINVINSTIYGNDAAAFPAGRNLASGGGIYNRGALNVSNSTISGNSADTAGGGIYDDSQATGNATIKSTIIAKNIATGSDPDVAGSFTSQGFNLIGKNDGSTGLNATTDLTGTVSSPLDPKLAASLQNNGGLTLTIALLSGSPAIDKGTSNGLAGTLTTDQRGVGYKRTINKSVANAIGGDGTDIGAFELGAQIKAVSRKTHGTAGMFDITLPLTGTKVGVECRKSGSSHVFTVIITFPNAVTVGSASATPDAKAPGATGSVSSFSVNSKVVTVNLTGVSNAQRIVITLFDVSDGTNTNDVSVPMGVLFGDTNNNGSVASNDVTLTQSKVGQIVSKTTFREDVTLDGLINSTDVQQVQSKVGTKLP